MLLALLFGSLALVLAMLRVYLHAIIVAVLLASLFAPLHRRLQARWPARHNLAAFLAMSAVFLVLLVPSGVLLSALVRQGITTVQSCQQWIAEGRVGEALNRVRLTEVFDRPSLRFLGKPLAAWLGVSDLKDVNLTNSRLSAVLAGLGQRLMNLLGGWIAPLLAGTGQFLVGFAVMLFVLFFAFRDGRQAMEYARHLLPLTRSQEDALINRIRDVTRAVVLGTAVTSLAQGVAAMVAFAIVGIPALFWGSVLAVASLIPVVGTAIVWLPAVGYLLLVGKTGSAVFLALWCIVVVGSLDNILRPIVMGGRSGMSSLVVFFSVVGGLQLFGPMGIVYGPLIFGVCAVCIYTYELENAAFLRSQGKR